MLNRALFLDRDGIINEDQGYVHTIDEFKFIPDIFNLVRLAKSNNYLVIIVTNQAGIGRGYYTESEFDKLNNWMLSEFTKQNAPVDGVYYSPYHPTHGKGKYLLDSDLRKPKPGMFLKAAVDFDIDLESSIIIGDNLSDVFAGKNAGIKKRILVGGGYCKSQDYINVASVGGAVEVLRILL